MPDQAAGLRSLFARRRPSLLIVAGCDPSKAAVAVHFAREAAAGDRATVLIDGTAGHVAGACDLSCRYELSHVIAGDVALSDVVRSITPRLLLLPAARALSRFGAFTADEQARLADVFSSGITGALADGDAEAQVDLVVVNAEDGAASRAIDAFGRDARVIVVASETPQSLRGAYAEMKLLSQTHGLENFEIATPRFNDTPASGVVFANLSATARRFLEIDLVDGGSIALSSPKSVGSARPLIPSDADRSAAQSLSSSQIEVSHAAVLA